MRALVITIGIVLVALVTTGFFIFSGNDQYQDEAGETETPDTETTIQPGANDTQTGQQMDVSTPQTYSVQIKGYAYNQSTLNIKAGDTVIWTNKDTASHTVTSDSGSELASEYLSRDQTFSHTFTQAGTYKYHCAPHPNMKATVVVG